MRRYVDSKVRDYIKNHLTEQPIEPCDLKVGDVVTFTNENGVVFNGNIVIGFSNDLLLNRHASENSQKRLVHTISKSGNDAYWFPKRVDSLKHEGRHVCFDNHLGFMN